MICVIGTLLIRFILETDVIVCSPSSRDTVIKAPSQPQSVSAGALGMAVVACLNEVSKLKNLR